MSQLGTVITFYSYKGGTGRTMALANTGVALAREGVGDVLMIDWDLEAPGLVNFFPEVEAQRSTDGPLMPGVLELFENAHDALGHRSDVDESSAHTFWRGLEPQRFTTETNEPSLHLMRAGNLNESYGERVNTFEWRSLFANCPALFKAFADELASRYRYVLIDSRTGLSDSSGVCTTLLPDRLVVVFTPNRQSLTGVVDLVRGATVYRGRSPDLRPLLVFPLASRVEMSEDELRREWRYGEKGTPGYQPRFERLFEEVYDLPECSLERYFDEIQIQHATSYAYGERVAVRDERSDRLSLSRSYERFGRALLDAEPAWEFEAEAHAEPGSEGSPDFVLGRLEAARKRHEFQANRTKNLDTGLLFGMLGVLVAGLLIYALLSVPEGANVPPFVPWIASTATIAAVIAAIRLWLAPRPKYVIHARAANALTREPALFFSEAGPYAGRTAPVAVLAERLDHIEQVAEDALLDPRGSSHPFGVGRVDDAE